MEDPMTTFTEDFTGMREEFDQSHQDRQEFCEHLTEDCAERTETNRQELKEMGDQVRGELADFAGDLKTGGKIFRRGFMSR